MKGRTGCGRSMEHIFSLKYRIRTPPPPSIRRYSVRYLAYLEDDRLIKAQQESLWSNQRGNAVRTGSRPDRRIGLLGG